MICAQSKIKEYSDHIRAKHVLGNPGLNAKKRLFPTKSPGTTFTPAVKREIIALLKAEKAKTTRNAAQPKYRALPSLKRLNELFVYNPETGILTAKIARGGLLVGQEVGTMLHGYRSVFIDYAQWRVHRVAFKMHHGHDPQGVVHHLSGKRDDNRIVNLVDTSPLENSRQRHKANSNTGIVGVSYCNAAKRYLADIGANGRSIHLGRFVELECAVKARLLAEREFYGFDRRALEVKEAA